VLATISNRDKHNDVYVYSHSTSGGTGTALHFAWSVKGRPALVAEPSFQAVCWRTSRYIWHHIEGDVDCSGVRITNFSGSHFPTHTVYVDGVRTRTIPQGEFRNLWTPSPSNLTMVE
jgi:hypothetical protein